MAGDEDQAAGGLSFVPEGGFRLCGHDERP